MLMVFTTVQQNYFKNTDIRTKFHLSSEKRNPGIAVLVRFIIFAIYWCCVSTTQRLLNISENGTVQLQQCAK